jgi:hypothetical protein
MFYVAICAMSFVVTVPASSKQAPWGWFSASSTGSNWSVVEGKADVSISPSSFFAQLHSSNAFLMVTLKGTVLDRKVVARATFHGTDKPSATLIGNSVGSVGILVEDANFLFSQMDWRLSQSLAIFRVISRVYLPISVC